MRPSGEMGRVLRTLAYRRVSTREQGVAGTSLDAQKTEIARYCTVHGLPEPLDHVEVESGGEESEEKRSEVMRLLSSVRPGDAVIVSKIDRFARDMVFIVKHVRAIRKRPDPLLDGGGDHRVLGQHVDVAEAALQRARRIDRAPAAGVVKSFRSSYPLHTLTRAGRYDLLRPWSASVGGPGYGRVSAKGKKGRDHEERAASSGWNTECSAMRLGLWLCRLARE